MNGLTEGRIVHFVMPSGQHRPAIIVKVWRVTGAGNIQDPPENGLSNLTVFVDGLNDIKPSVSEMDISPVNNVTLLMRVTSIVYSEEHLSGTWHWIEQA